MSKPPPFTVFSSRIDPTGVLEGLREAGAQLEVLEGTSLANWRRVRASWPTGAGRRDFLVRHDPDYYADDSWGQQLPGMFSYFLRAGAPLPVLAMIRAFRFSVSLEAEGSFPEAGDPRFDGLSAVCERLDGAVLVPSGLLDASGRALFLLDRQADEEAVLPAPAEPHPLLLAQGGLYEPASAAQLPFPAMRRASCKRLQEVGFAAPYALPQDDQSQLRPKQEIARRLLALRALFMWVGRKSVPAADVQTAVRRDDLKADLDEDERQQLTAPRAEANQRWGDVVGWRLENMWSLAWVLGFAPAPPVAPGMIRDQTIQTLLGFLPPLADALGPWVARLRMRPESEVLAEADLFYCAHNSVRSAQQGRVSVPADFHPLRDGGVIHERRHALTWCVSPGVGWSDTDLST